jgi:hypothetical protein
MKSKDLESSTETGTSISGTVYKSLTEVCINLLGTELTVKKISLDLDYDSFCTFLRDDQTINGSPFLYLREGSSTNKIRLNYYNLYGVCEVIIQCDVDSEKKRIKEEMTRLSEQLKKLDKDFND